MKKLFIILLILPLFMGYSQEQKQHDSTAIFILDKMADIIGVFTNPDEGTDAQTIKEQRWMISAVGNTFEKMGNSVPGIISAINTFDPEKGKLFFKPKQLEANDNQVHGRLEISNHNSEKGELFNLLKRNNKTQAQPCGHTNEAATAAATAVAVVGSASSTSRRVDRAASAASLSSSF